MTAIQPVPLNKSARSPKVRTLGLVAMGFCALGYAGFLISFFAIKAGYLSVGIGVTLAGVFAVMGEGGLWIGAACLGLSLYTRRKEKLARFMANIRASLKR